MNYARELRPTYRVVGNPGTNTDESYLLRQAADGLVISGEERVIKPDPRIFRILLERYGLTADATVFIDDQVANVEAAEAVGIRGIRFVDAVALRRDLRAVGLSLSETADGPASRATG